MVIVVLLASDNNGIIGKSGKVILLGKSGNSGIIGNCGNNGIIASNPRPLSLVRRKR